MMESQRKQEPHFEDPPREETKVSGLQHNQKDALVAFMSNPSGYDVAEVTVNLCGVYNGSKLSDEERDIANDILARLSKSMEVRVRQSLSEHLKNSAILPHEIAFSLAQDVATVALPMLEYSEVLSDEDLIKLVRTCGEEHQAAVAKREYVSEAVSDAIVDEGNENPIFNLMKNDGAQITEHSYDNVIRLFPEHESIKSAMAERPDLPVTVAEKLVDMVSEGLKFELISRNATSAPLIDKLLQQGSEDATIAILSQHEDTREAEDLAMQLHKLNRLTPTLLLRALYYGQVDFFEYGVSRLAQVHVRDARNEIHSAKPYAFQRLYRRAGLPAQLFLAFTEALSRLSGEIRELPTISGDSHERRQVSSLLVRRDFDRDQFEAALIMAGQQ